MAHSMKSTLFRQRLDKGLLALVNSTERIQVMSLPRNVSEAVASNRKKLALFCGDLSEEARELVVDMLNDDWGKSYTSLDGHGLIHYCTPYCCRDQASFECRMKDALQHVFAGMFDVPLLYRWKAFDPAAEWTGRGLAIHKLLPILWGWCRTDKADTAPAEDLCLWDEDSADIAPAMKQQVRMSKAQVLLNDEGSLVSWV